MAITPLQQLIIERIEREGPITFAEYMRMALYEPGYGYYVTGAAKMGWEGDYYTSTDISNLFAHCMGRQLLQLWEKMGRPAQFIVLEQGAGRGHLAEQIRTWAARDAAGFSAALDYCTQDLRTGQDIRLDSNEGAGDREGRPYISDTTEPGQNAGTGSEGPAVILSNELIDAFPVHIVEARNGRLYEVYVDADPHTGCLSEVLDELSTPEVAGYLDRFKIPWRAFGENWRAEINLDALQWMEKTAKLLQKGFILTIDYGDKARALYTRERHRGTLACYFRHQMSERPLAHPGEQDITAHVNFSALIDEGRRYGLRQHKFTTQRLWLQDMGIYEELERMRQEEFSEVDTERATDRGQVALLKWYNLRQRVAALTDPAGMGNFKILIQRR